MKKVETLIIGAGFAGLSTAYHLAKKGQKNLMILEKEKKLGGHASGRNAGMIRQSISDPVLVHLARQGCRALQTAQKAGWANLKFNPRGSLLLAKGNKVSELRKTAASLRRQHIAFKQFSREDAVQLVPVLAQADFEEGLYCPSDAFLDIEALLSGFLKALKKMKVPVQQNADIRSIRKVKSGFKVTVGSQVILANRIVNAAGAWAGEVARMARAEKVPFKAYRRHLFTSRFPAFSSERWPFVWDLSHELYFRPYGDKTLLLSPCDQTAVSRRYAVARIEKVDPAMEKKFLMKFRNFSSAFDSLKIIEAKSGLRTMTPDGRFVIGEDKRLKGFFWVAGLGGHGVTTSFSCGQLASDMILGRKVDERLRRTLSPGRFS